MDNKLPRPGAAKIIRFKLAVGQKKPENVITGRSPCPFCRPESLTGIIAAEGDIILLKNKYPVLYDADQFVLVESAVCSDGIEHYTKAKNRRLFQFALSHYARLLADSRYQSVIFFKNSGPLSGGTMRHPHMQLVGFFDVPPTALYEEGSFSGVEIAAKDGAILKASDAPLLGFNEYVIEFSPTDLILPEETTRAAADMIQCVVRHLIENDWRKDPSYNIFFYRLPDRYAARILPRYATSPLFVGYDLRILPDDLHHRAARLKKKFAEYNKE